MNDPAHAFAVLASALRDDPALAETRDEIERIAEGSGAQHELVALYGELAASLTDALLARDYWMRIAGIDDRLGDVDRGRAGVLPGARARSRRTPRRLRRSSSSSRGRSGGRTSSASSSGASSRRTTHASARPSTPPWRRSTTSGSAVPRTPLRRTRRCSSSSRAAIVRSARSTTSSRARRCGRSSPRTSRRSSRSPPTDEAQLALMLRLVGAARTRDGARRRRHRRLPPGARARADEPAGARGARAPRPGREVRAHDRRSPRAAVPARRRLAEAHRRRTKCRSGEARTSLVASSSSTRSPSSTRTRPASSRAAFATLARALKEDPANEATQQQLDRVARATGRFADLAQVFEELAGEIEDPTLASALYMTSARVQENGPRQRRHGDRPLPEGPRDRSAEPRRGRVARASVPRVRAVLRSSRSSCSASPRSSRSRRTRRTRSSRPLRSKRTSSTAPKRRSPSTARFSRSTRTICARSTRSSAATSICRAGRTCSPSTHRKADLVADVDEKKGIYYQVGAVYERELGDVPRAIDTYTKILELDPDDLQALSRLDVLYEQRRELGGASRRCSRARAR